MREAAKCSSRFCSNGGIAITAKTPVSYYMPGRPEAAYFILPDILFVACVNRTRITVSPWHYPRDFFMVDKK